jgi:hypothetical protein
MTREDKLRDVLRSEVADVDPSADGWRKIRDGIERRSRRKLMMRLAYAGSGAVAVAAAATLFFVVGDSPGRDDKVQVPPASQDPTTKESTPAPDPSASVDDATTKALATSLWPFHEPASASSWRPGTGMDYLAAPQSTAEEFLHRVLPDTELTVQLSPATTDRQRTGAVTRKVAGQSFTIAKVSVRRYGADGPWFVTGLSNAYLTITSPMLGAPVTGEAVVRGQYPPGDPGLQVYVFRSDTDIVELGHKTATTGPEGYSATVPFTSSGSGFVLVTNDSGVDGKESAATALPIRLSGGDGLPPPTNSPIPDAYVAVVDQRIAVVDTGSGQVDHYLTELQPGGGVSDPQLAPDGTVVYAEGSGTCASAIKSVPLRGGVSTTVIPAGSYQLSQPTKDAAGLIAFARTNCSTGGAVEIVVHGPDGKDTVVTSGDIEVAGGLAWFGDSLAFVARNEYGSQVAVHRVGAPAGESPMWAAGTGCTWTAVTQRGTSDRLLAAKSCAAGRIVLAELSGMDTVTPIVSFTGAAPTRIDTDATGQHVIWWATTGTEETSVFERSNGESPRKLATNQAYPSW